MKAYYKAEKVMIERKDLSDSEKIMLVVLASLSQQQGYCFATNATLASLLGWSIDKTKNNLRTIAAKGLIDIRIEDGNRREISMSEEGVQNYPTGVVQNCTGGSVDLHGGGCKTAQGGVQNDTPLHNREYNRTSNRTSNREERTSADDLEEFDSEGNPTTHPPTPKKQSGGGRARFIPPTLQECELYFQAQGYPQEASKFFNYYESKGWLVGKHKMQKWKSSAAGWISRSKEYTKTQNNGKQQPVTEQLMRDIADDIANGGWNFADGA